MGKYTVIWWLPSRDDLAKLWLDSRDRDEITKAAYAIDRTLAVNPSNKGVGVREELRRLEIEPLAVQFSVDEDDRRVTVWSVRRTRDEQV